MELNLKHIANIEQERLLTVFGYVREYEGKSRHEIVESVILVCALFYGNDIDEWDPKYLMKCIELKGMTITARKFRQCSSFCKHIIESGRFKWKFQLTKMSFTEILIGIYKIKPELELQTDSFFTKGGGKGYAFGVTTSKLTNRTGYTWGGKYGKKCKTGSIVEMILDLNELTLRFIIDGIDYGKAFDIEKCKYRAAVYLVGQGDAVTIIE